MHPETSNYDDDGGDSEAIGDEGGGGGGGELLDNENHRSSSRIFFTDNNENMETSLETSYDYLIKLLLLGDSCVGKTCFLHRYTDGQFREKFIATVGVDFRLKKLIYELPGADSKKVKVHVQLWDTAGQERYRSLTKAFFRDGMGFLLFFDLTNENSFRSVQDWISEIRENAYTKSPDILLIGNKCDLDNQAISSSQAKAQAETLGIPYFETSAATGQNVEEAVSVILERIMKRMQDMQEQEEEDGHEVCQHQQNHTHHSSSRSVDLGGSEGQHESKKKASNCSC